MWSWLRRLFRRKPTQTVYLRPDGSTEPPGVKVDRSDPYRRKGWVNFLILREDVDLLGRTSTKEGVSPKVVVRALFEMFSSWTEEQKKAFCWECLLRGVPDTDRQEMIPDYSLEELAMLQVEQLEQRTLPSVTLPDAAVGRPPEVPGLERSAATVALEDGVLSVAVNGPGVHAVSVDFVNDGTQVQVTADGQTFLFDRAAVELLDLDGARNGQNIIQNNTNIDSEIAGGNLADTLFGGSGANTIDPGKGPDVVYALLGQNTITSKDGAPDTILTNAGATINADAKDQTVRFFGAGRTPGTPFIGFDDSLADGVLYITPSNNGSMVVLDSDGTPGSVIATVDLGDGLGLRTLTFEGVRFISYFGGTGDDIYQNNTGISEAAYGSAGNDSLTGGIGALTVLKGSGGNDTLVGRARQNDLSGNGGADSITSLNPGQDVFRVDDLDQVFGAAARDVFISP